MYTYELVEIHDRLAAELDRCQHKQVRPLLTAVVAALSRLIAFCKFDDIEAEKL